MVIRKRKTTPAYKEIWNKEINIKTLKGKSIRGHLRK